MKIEKKVFKIVNILIVILILFICCVLAIQHPEKYIFILLPSKYLVLILSIIGIVAIIYLSFFLIRLIFARKAFFEINEKGIHNGLGLTKEKQIEWNNIEEVDIINYKGIQRIRIKLYNYHPFIENTDFITKFILKQTVNDLGTPIIIDNVYLKCSFDELSKIILDSWKKYKNQSK
ncbi:STM3941 family protein [Chryseobacterium kwangjuense]|uniref:STM3941 family protein n=1 Tax=Chryseobacterium kwangjuense TaxID=267125 RepID=A0ABW9K274_9FLAO